MPGVGPVVEEPAPFLAEAEQPYVAGEAVDLDQRPDQRRAGVVALALARPFADEPQEASVQGVQNLRVARARIVQKQRAVVEMRAPGVVVFVLVVAWTIRAKIAVGALAGEKRVAPRRELRPEAGVAERQREHQLAQAVLAGHLGAPPRHVLALRAGELRVVVVRHAGFLELVGVEFAVVPAHAVAAAPECLQRPPARGDGPRRQRNQLLPLWRQSPVGFERRRSGKCGGEDQQILSCFDFHWLCVIVCCRDNPDRA